MNTFGPTASDQKNAEWYEYKGDTFFCLSCERDNEYVRGIAGPELEELKRTDNFGCLGDLLKCECVLEHAVPNDPKNDPESIDELTGAVFGMSHPFPEAMKVPKGETVDHLPSRMFWYSALAKYLVKVQEEVKGQKNRHKGRRVMLPYCVRSEIQAMYGVNTQYMYHDFHPARV